MKKGQDKEYIYFKFDRVFGTQVSQEEVYKKEAEAIIYGKELYNRFRIIIVKMFLTVLHVMEPDLLMGKQEEERTLPCNALLMMKI